MYKSLLLKENVKKELDILKYEIQHQQKSRLTYEELFNKLIKVYRADLKDLKV